jgi:hypothetical protein
MDDQPRCVFIADGEIQAQQISAFLKASGISSVLRGESLRKTHGFTIDGLGAVAIFVPVDDEERARTLLASAEAGELRIEDEGENPSG